VVVVVRRRRPESRHGAASEHGVNKAAVTETLITEARPDDMTSLLNDDVNS
jgi:hypothetical protein